MNTTSTNEIDLDIQKAPRVLERIPGLLWAFRIHHDGTSQSLPIDRPIEIGHEGWLWLHFNSGVTGPSAWLEALDLPAPAAALLLSRDRTQQLHASENCVYGIFADLKRDLGQDGDEMSCMHFAMTERVLVSGRRHALAAAAAARETIQKGARTLPHVASLLELIVEHVVEAVNGLAEKLAVQLDEIEDGLATSGGSRADRLRLGQIQRRGVRLHQGIAGLRAVFHRLERDDSAVSNPAMRLSSARLAQSLDGSDHEILHLRERARLLQEEATVSMAEETNRHLNILTIVTTLLLPPTLISGIYGMNVKGIPFADNDPAFGWVAGLMIASSLAVYFAMRRIGIVGP
jgi:zinc transporter